MASVHLTFQPPDREGMTQLLIYESPDDVSALTLIETVTPVGTYPNYIAEYTTDNATSKVNWFAIEWKDAKGAGTGISQRMMGGTHTLLGEIVRRAHERMPTLPLQIVIQEAEGVIQMFLGEDTDPYDETLTATYRQKNGLTYMTIARTLMAQVLMSSSVQEATMGLVSFKTGTQTNQVKNITDLIALAEADLGISGSQVLNMTRLCQVYGGPDWRQLHTFFNNDQEFRVFIPYLPRSIEQP